MKMRKFALPVLGFAFTLAGLSFASAQTTPSVQNAQKDSINKIHEMESAQDKSVLRQEQKGTLDTGRAVLNPTMRDNTTNDNLAPDDAKRLSEQRVNAAQQPPPQASPTTTMPNSNNNRVNAQTQPPGQKQVPQSTTKTEQTRMQDKTQTVTTPSGTTKTQTQTTTRTHVPGETPDRTMIKTRTVTTADGKTIEKEYYNDFEVIRDANGRRYYVQDGKNIYIRETEVRDSKQAVPDTRDDRSPAAAPLPNNTNTPKQ